MRTLQSLLNISIADRVSLKNYLPPAVRTYYIYTLARHELHNKTTGGGSLCSFLTCFSAPIINFRATARRMRAADRGSRRPFYFHRDCTKLVLENSSTNTTVHLYKSALIFAGINFRGLQVCSIFTDFIFADAGNEST